MALVQHLEALPGTVPGIPWATPPPSPAPPGRLVGSQRIQCQRGDAGVALLICAERG